jgi:preprotein translocase YajC subunit
VGAVRPFALVLGIFYFVILLPMKRKQQKVDSFLAALKVGDKRRDLGGIFGSITDIKRSVHTAGDCREVRVQVSRNASSATRGRNPSLLKASHEPERRVEARSHRRRHRSVGRVLLLQGMNLGLDLKGGVHLVMRVQTDDALRVQTETTVEQLRDALTRGSIQFSKLEMKDAKTFVVEGVTNDQAFRAAAVDADSVYNRSSGVGSLHLHDEAQHREPAPRRGGDAGAADDRAARQRAGRGRADRGAQGAVDPDPGRAARRQRSAARQGHHPLDGAARAEDRRAGPVRHRGAAKQAYNNNVRPTFCIMPGSGDSGAAALPARSSTHSAARRW